MEFVIKAASTAMVVALVLIAARRLGDRAAGFLAGLPFTTVPALGWIAASQGADLACRTSIGSVAGCMLVPVFAVAYDRGARRWAVRGSLSIGLAAIGGATVVAGALPLSLWPAVVACVLGSLGALRALRVTEQAQRQSCPASMRSTASCAALAGVVGATVASLASGANPQLAGLLAGLPTLGLLTLVRQHRRQGAAAVTPFLRGYVISTLGKALFGAVFATCAPCWGPTPAMLGAIACGIAFCLVAMRIDRRDRAAPMSAHESQFRTSGQGVQNGDALDTQGADMSSTDSLRHQEWRHRRGAWRVALAVGAALSTMLVARPGLARDAGDPPPPLILQARVIATGLQGAHGVSQVGRFHAGGPFVGNPEFLLGTQPGRVLDPERLLVATDADGGMLLSIDAAATSLRVPSDLATRPPAAGGPIQVYSARTGAFANGVHNAQARTARETAVASPRYLSINNAFGRPWIANAPRGVLGDGTLSVTDPDGAPLANAPSDFAGGVFAGDRTPRASTATSMHTGWFAARFERRDSGQLTRGSLDHGAFGTAFLGASPDGTGFAVFAAVTGTGAVVQVHVQDGVDGLAPPGTLALDRGDPGVVGIAFRWSPRRALFVAEARADRIAVLHLGDDARQFVLAGVERLGSPWLHHPVDLAPAVPEVANPRFSSNTTLAGGSDLYVANQGDGSLLRLGQDGRLVARAVLAGPDGRAIGAGELRAIAVSSDAQRIWVVVHPPGNGGDALLEVSAFDARGAFGLRRETPAERSHGDPSIARGAQLFGQAFTPETGLGPRFNATSCASCHAGGRGASSDEAFFARRVAHVDARSGRILPIEGLDSLVAPHHGVDDPNPLAPPREANVVSLRMPLALVAAARIDEIDDAAIEAQAVAKGDGIHGRVHRIADGAGGARIGRYGWKADVATLDEMVATAFADELGMASALAPRPRVPMHDDGAMAQAVAAFIRGESAPPGRPEVARLAALQERAP